MKQILILFAVALLVSGCISSPVEEDSGQASLKPPTSSLSSCSARILRPKGEKSPPCIETHGDPKSLQQALVIGNGDYDHSALYGPIKDANDMTDTLLDLGFYVTQANNLDFQTMDKVVSDFSSGLSRLSNTTEGVAFFYFSGHGARTNGENFLIPTNNSKITVEHELKGNAVSVQNMLAEMEEANPGVNLLVLDACNNNPYPNSGKSDKRGLARIVPKKVPKKVGSVVAFAAAPGQLAIDLRSNGLYTSKLIDVLKKHKHEPIEEVFKKTAELVAKITEDEQIPWYHSSLRGGVFCLDECRNNESSKATLPKR